MLTIIDIEKLRRDNHIKYGYTIFNGSVIRELLVKGNDKIGKTVYHFSTTPTCENGGTCFCTCKDGYCTKGNYRRKSVKKALAMRTNVVKTDLDYFVAEMIREIKAHKILFVRIHVTGDFFSRDYVRAWIRIALACPETTFWTYTKSYGHGFDDDLHELNSLENVNIVESVIPGCGYNFGHCNYVMDTYYKLLSDGKNPYICPCGSDDSVHCCDCKQCAKRQFVLFIEHSTGYNAKKDPLFPDITALINSQRKDKGND